MTRKSEKMGMFDTILINSKCPNCGQMLLRSYQTKDLECVLHTYNVGDCIEDDIHYEESKESKYLEAIGSCHSDECTFKGNVSDILLQGCPSGFGFLWSCKIKLDDNYCITNKVCDIKIISTIPDDWEEIIKYRYGDYWKFLLERYKGNKKKAVDEFDYGKNRIRFIIMVRKLDCTRLTYREIKKLMKNEEYRKERTIRCSLYSEK